MEASRARRTPPASTGPECISQDTRPLFRVTVQVTCVWWKIGQVYQYVGATTAAQKRRVRRVLAAMEVKGVDGISQEPGKRGEWWVASAVIRERFTDDHDWAIVRRMADTEQRARDTSRRAMDTERTTPSRDLGLIAASGELKWTSDGGR
jgi:hypothetical protein